MAMYELDRISWLPNCLLHLILSNLTTKESVRTSSLSKRWIQVWKSVPRLDLDASDFNHEKDYISFANSMFHHKLFPYHERLETFNLTWPDCDDDNYPLIIKTWLSNLVYLKPRVVNIIFSNLDDDIDIGFGPYLFTFSTMESLNLWTQYDDYRYLIMTPKVIYLPCLKILKLRTVYLTDEFIQTFLLGCPALEELFLEDCFCDVTGILTSFTLKKLVISRSTYTKKSMLRICMPSLEYLSCEVRSDGFLFENLTSLDYASITLLDMHRKYSRKGFALRGLSNAKTIRIFSGLYDQIMLKMESSEKPIFEKLESLYLENFFIQDMEPITSFLRLTANLSRLTLRNITMVGKSRIMRWREHNEIQCGSLKTVEVLCFSPHKEIDKLINFLLIHLNAVENFSIKDYYQEL